MDAPGVRIALENGASYSVSEPILVGHLCGYTVLSAAFAADTDGGKLGFKYFLKPIHRYAAREDSPAAAA